MANTFQQQRKRLVREGGFKLIQLLEKLIVAASPHGDPTFFDPAEFPWTRRLEANWQTIRKELDQVLEMKDDLPNFQDISEDQKGITQDNRWKTFFFYGYGFKSEENCRRCPETARLVESVPGMKTAFFSILEPGKHIPPHRGPYKGVMRYHLGLKVPEPNEKVRIRVGDDVRHWEEGKSLLFDDTHEHEVWNDTDGTRVILFMDVVRPLNPPMNVINDLIIYLIGKSHFVQDAKKNQQKWEQRVKEKAPQKAAAATS